MPVGIEAWVTQIPPVTRAWLALSVLTSVAVVSKSFIHIEHVFVLHLSATAMSTRNTITTIL